MMLVLNTLIFYVNTFGNNPINFELLSSAKLVVQ